MPDDKKPEEQPLPTLQIGDLRPPQFSIFVNPNPTITSLSPVGAVVGGSAFTLTVFGTQFNNSSSALWNQASRPTTFVSSTQLTAAITVADIGTAGAATVTVSNPATTPTGAPLVSNGVTFNIIPDISDIINQLKTVTANPPTVLANLQTYITIQQSQVDTLTAQVSSDQTNISNLNSQIANLQNQVTQQQNQIATLTSQLAAAKSQTALPLDVAQSFKGVVDQIQQTALAAGGIQTTLTKMDVQVKALVNVQPATATAPAQATLVFPDPTALPDPNHLSTLTFSFGAIPNLKPASSGPGSASPSSSAGGGPSSRSSG